jgi:hypothetical protein
MDLHGDEGRRGDGRAERGAIGHDGVEEGRIDSVAAVSAADVGAGDAFRGGRGRDRRGQHEVRDQEQHK